MTNNQKLEQQLWNIANTLRGKMGAGQGYHRKVVLNQFQPMKTLGYPE